MASWIVSPTALFECFRGSEPYKAINVHGPPISGKSTLVLASIIGGLQDDISGIFFYGTGSIIEASHIADTAEGVKRRLDLGLRVVVLKDPNELASHTGSPGKVLLVMTLDVMRAVLSIYKPAKNTTVFIDQDRDASVEYVMSLTSALSHTDNLSLVYPDQENHPVLKFRLVILSEEPLNDWQQGLVHHFTALRKDVPREPADDERVFHPTKLDKVQGLPANNLGLAENHNYVSQNERDNFIQRAMCSSSKTNLLWVGHIRTAARIMRQFSPLQYTVTSTTDPDDFERTYKGLDTNEKVVVIVDPNIRLSPNWLQSLGITHVLCTGNDMRGNVVADTLMRTLVEDRSDGGVLTDWQAKRMLRLSEIARIPLENAHIEQPTGHDPEGKGRLLFCRRDLSAFLFRMVEHTESRNLRWILHIWFQRPNNGLLDSCLVDEMLGRLKNGGIVEVRGNGHPRLAVVVSDRAKAFGELLADVKNNFGAARILAGIKSRHAAAGDNLKTILVSLAVILAFQLEKPVVLRPETDIGNKEALEEGFYCMSYIERDSRVWDPLNGFIWVILLMWQCVETGKFTPLKGAVAVEPCVFEQMTQMRERITKKLGMPTMPLGPTTAEDRTVIFQELLLATMDRVLWVHVDEGSHWPGTAGQKKGHGIRLYDLVSEKEVLPGPCCRLLDVQSLVEASHYKRGLWAVSSQPLIKDGDSYFVADLTFMPIDTIYKWSTHKVDRDQDDVEREHGKFNIRWIASLFV